MFKTKKLQKNNVAALFLFWLQFPCHFSAAVASLRASASAIVAVPFQHLQMETTPLLDLVTGGLALAVLIGGLLMLFNGISAFGDKDK